MKKSIGNKTVSYPLPVYIVGTYDKYNTPNIMAASWGGICCSKPPCIAISVRQSRYTYDNIVLNKAFTVNIPDTKNVKSADYCGIYSGKDENKFESLKLTASKSELINAPTIEEYPVSIICKLKDNFDLGSHTQFVGEILDILVDEEKMDKDGNPDILKIDPILYDYISRSYFGIGKKTSKAFMKHK